MAGLNAAIKSLRGAFRPSMVTSAHAGNQQFLCEAEGLKEPSKVVLETAHRTAHNRKRQNKKSQQTKGLQPIPKTKRPFLSWAP